MEFKFWPGATLDSIFSVLRSPHFHIHKINKYWYFILCLKYIFRAKKLKFMLEFSQNKVVHVVLCFVFSTVRNPQSAFSTMPTCSTLIDITIFPFAPEIFMNFFSFIVCVGEGGA